MDAGVKVYVIHRYAHIGRSELPLHKEEREQTRYVIVLGYSPKVVKITTDNRVSLDRLILCIMLDHILHRLYLIYC